MDWMSSICSGQSDREKSFEFEVWAKELEPALKEDVRFLPLRWNVPGRIPSLLVSAAEVSLRALFAKIQRPGDQPIFISNGFLYSHADLVSVHFSGLDWLFKSYRLGFAAPGAVSGTLRAGVVSALDSLFQWSLVPNRLVAVSEGVGNDLRRFSAPWKSVQVIPNLSPPREFSPAGRDELRPRVREQWGRVEDDERVLAFCSLGHLRRKGFWLAVEAIALARKKGARLLLLVIGVEKESIRKTLSRVCPDWDDFIRFTGPQQDVRMPLSACDGYLFPSYSEAFSLTEIEAAALGLRLYLTPHHGVEMFYPEHFHGRVLPWEVEEMGELLVDEWVQGNVEVGPSSPNCALSLQKFGERWRNQIEAVLAERELRARE